MGDDISPNAGARKADYERKSASWKLVLPSLPENPALLVLLLVGFGLLFVATWFEVASHVQDAGAGTGEHVVDVWMLSPRVAFGLFREIGFALIISFMIGWLIEGDSKRRQEHFVEDFSERVSKDVFASVLGKFLPQKFQDAFIDVGKSHTVRTNMMIRYELTEFSDEEVRKVASLKEQFIKLHIFTDYTLENISGSSYSHPVVCAYPVRQESEFHKALSRIERIKIGKQELTRAEIDDDTDDADEERRDFAKFTREIPLQAGEQLQVTYEVVLVKERSDNEVWVSLIPTDQLWILCDTGALDTDMKFGIAAHCPSGMQERTVLEDGGGLTRHPNAGIWASGGPILPYQSVVFWWRTLPDTGTNEPWQAAGSATAKEPTNGA